MPNRANTELDLRTAPGALVVGGAQTSLGVARSLGRHGIRVWLASDHPIASYSRYVERSFIWAGSDHQDAAATLLDIGTRNRLDGWVLFATGDEDLRLLAENHAALSSRFRVASPPLDVAQWMLDKRLSYERAREVGVNHPWTVYPVSLADVERLECRFPVIIKPGTRRNANDFTRAKAWKAESREELIAYYKRATELVRADEVMIQEMIPGTGETQFSYAALWHRGELVASLVARRTRQYPIEFGRSSTYVETLDNHEVEGAGYRFLKSLDYTGVAELEFKYDARDERYKLLDVNGRFWTWNALGAAAGTDFAYLAWRLAIGEKVAVCRARPGVAWLYGTRDVLAALRGWAAGKLSLGDYVRSLLRPMVFATAALDDPLPALIELPLIAWSRLGKHRALMLPRRLLQGIGQAFRSRTRASTVRKAR